jgi:hypothetical protein
MRIEPFVAKAVRAVTIRSGRCVLHRPIPSDPEKKLQFLDSLSRTGCP